MGRPPTAIATRILCGGSVNPDERERGRRGSVLTVMRRMLAAREKGRTVGVWLDDLFFDLRLALRGLRRDRTFSLAAIAMLALAIGLNATVFIVMQAMLFRGFPHVKQNDRLVYLQERDPSGRCCLSYPDFEDWVAQAQTF